jgi:hypothetical protein
VRNETANEIWFALEPRDGPAHLLTEFILIMASDVTQFDILQLILDAFIGVQIR